MSLHVRDHLSNKFPVFLSLFDKFEQNNSVLDFGGNRGNLLYFSNNKIKEEKYLCIDVDQHALNVGKSEFPNATWLHYNQYNWMYNHQGNVNEPFPKVSNTDYIWAYSVFTHTDFVELKNTIEWFYSLNPINGAISILDINNKNIVDYFTEKRIDEYGNCVDVNQYKDCNIVYLGNNDLVTTDVEKLDSSNCSHFLSFYNLNWLEERLKSYFPSIHIKYLTNNFSPFIILQ